MAAASFLSPLLERAGIELGGSRPWDLRLHDPRLPGRVARGGSLAFGEAYMDGWWDADDVGELCYRLLVSAARQRRQGSLDLPRLLNDLRRRFLNLQKKGGRARQVVEEHYDLPAHLFAAMLGETMAYSCAYWQGLSEQPAQLDAAQRAKLDLICRKLELAPGELVLDLGCGFGSFSRFAAQNYGVRVVAVNLSTSQLAFARDFCAGLPVEFYQCDYREVDTYAQGRSFDKVASIAMFEAIGSKNYRVYMEIVDRLLRDQGLFLRFLRNSYQMIAI